MNGSALIRHQLRSNKPSFFSTLLSLFIMPLLGWRPPLRALRHGLARLSFPAPGLAGASADPPPPLAGSSADVAQSVVVCSLASASCSAALPLTKQDKPKLPQSKRTAASNARFKATRGRRFIPLKSHFVITLLSSSLFNLKKKKKKPKKRDTHVFERNRTFLTNPNDQES